MKSVHIFLSPLGIFVGLACLFFPQSAQAASGPKFYWNVDEVRPGMKGHGRTVMKGTKVETFQAEVLGILKNTSPGRDLILCRLSGLRLDKTGVIAGMSGSPIYIKGRLLGAVAYAWSHGTEPIAGITPYSQMVGFVSEHEKRELAEQPKPRRVGLRRPLRINGKQFDAVTISQGFDDSPSHDRGEDLWLRPLRTPLAATGFSPASLRLLRRQCSPFGLVPMQGGATTSKIAEEAKVRLEPGGPLAISLITGDFDLSGIGTVTHIDGDRVYGWGHPFMSLGKCSFPMMTGYIHTVYPRRTVSFKMGSPLKPVGVIQADVSTCIAGQLGPAPDMLPVRMSIALGKKGEDRTFKVQIARQRSLLSSLVYTALVNSVDMEGDLPEEVTAHMQARIKVEGMEDLVIEDTFSGFSGRRAPQALYGDIARIVNHLTYNRHKPLRIKGIETTTRVLPERRTAEIQSVELASPTYAPGETLQATVFLRPYKKARRRVRVQLRLPADLPEGKYTLHVCDDPSNIRNTIRDNPELDEPKTLPQLLRMLRLKTQARRTRLVLRLPIGATGVMVENRALPNLPPSMVHILGNTRKTGTQKVRRALVSRRNTDWVIEGSESVRFKVAKVPAYRNQPR